MGLLGRILGRNRPVDATVLADRDWQERLRGTPVLQTPEEQQATRQRMVSELDAQRERRDQGASPPV